MLSSDLLPLLIAVPGGLVLGLIVHLSSRSRVERLAWGAGRSALSRADRREIRRATRQGRAVSERALAAPAVRFGEEVESSIARMPSWLSNPPHRVYVAGRIFFPLLGTAALVLGVTGNAASVASGIVLLAFTLVYLPVTERWERARRARRAHRVRASIDANRLLSADP